MTKSGTVLLAESLVGKTKEEVIAECDEKGIKYRIPDEDGVKHLVTADFNPERMNLYIAKGIVTDIKVN